MPNCSASGISCRRPGGTFAGSRVIAGRFSAVSPYLSLITLDGRISNRSSGDMGIPIEDRLHPAGSVRQHFGEEADPVAVHHGLDIGRLVPPLLQQPGDLLE